MASYSRSSFIPKSVTLNPQCRNNPVVLQIKSINNDMRKIDAYVALGLQGRRKLIEAQRKEDLQNQRRAKQTERFQKTKGNPINFIKENLPRTGFLDTIKNFILYTFMGMASQMVIKNLPAILNTLKLLVPIAGFLDKFFSNVLGGVVNAIDFGYKVHDKIRGVLKNITGSKFEKQFDELEKTLNTFLNIAIISGLAVAGSGAMPKFGGKPKAPVAGAPTSTAAGPSTSTAAGPKGLSGIAKRFSPFKKLPKPIAKFAGKFGKVFGRIPIIGGLIDFTLSVLMGENPGRAAARAVGSTAGAALGTFIPVPFAGTILGGILGDIVGGALYDTISSFGKPKGHAKGGQIGAKSYSRTPRTVKKSKAKRPPKQTPAPSRPGKSVGGKEEIVKIFPESEDPNVMSPLTMLTKNSAVMKRAGVFGSLMGAGLDMMALGQKVERSTLRGLERYLGYVIQSAIDNQSQTNARAIGASMYAMATGGAVPATRTLGGSGLTTGEMVAKEMMRSFTAMLDSRSTEIFQNIRKQLELKPKEQPVGPAMGDDSPAGQVFNALLAEGFTPEQAAGVVGNLMQESGPNINPNADNGGHHGIAQWDKGVRWPRLSAYIRSVGKDPNSLDGQIAGLIWEMKTHEKASYAALKQAKTAEEAARIFVKEFERSGESPGQAGYDRRIAYASQILQQFSSGALTAANIAGAVNLVPTSQFGWRRGRMHEGIDLVAEGVPTEHLPVIAKIGGRVDFAGFDGNLGLVIIDHPDGSRTRYLHLNNFKVKSGQTIPPGTVLGRLAAMNERGIDRSTGPHLHFEYIPKGGSAIDPVNVYSKYAALGGSPNLNVPSRNGTANKPRQTPKPNQQNSIESLVGGAINLLQRKPENPPKPKPRYNAEGETSFTFRSRESQLAQATNRLNRGPYSDSTNTVVMLQTVLT